MNYTIATTAQQTIGGYNAGVAQAYAAIGQVALLNLAFAVLLFFSLKAVYNNRVIHLGDRCILVRDVYFLLAALNLFLSGILYTIQFLNLRVVI